MGPGVALVQPVYHFKDVSRVGQGAWLIGLPEPDYTIFVDDDYRPVASTALFIPQPIGFGCFTLGVEVGQFGVRQTTQRRTPGTVGWNSVAADTQNLGIAILEPLVFLAERGCLRRSTSGEVEHMEG